MTAVAERLGAPLDVGVLGRPGVGRAAVAAGLAGAGVTIADDAARTAAQVLVIAEALKPEERALAEASSGATMVVLNKADLAGVDPGGPLSVAERRAAEFTATVGLPVVPMIAPLAAVELGDDEVAALRALVATPADMTSADAFVGSDHRLPAQMRERLLEKLDRFGLAHAVLAVAGGAADAAVVRQLRALSQVERVLEVLAAVTAPVRYRRVCAALRELRTLAAQSGDDRIDAFLAADDAVLAVMTAAVDVVEAAGLTVDRADDADAHLRRAVQWGRRAREPGDVTHQRCAKDIARGSLRLLGRSR
ncbi:hypothetical protein [Mycolicibacterium pyrenivorans]|uniref:hypothetical protein n=1 Tax=Mycolicibacterium pyrenivorans TaxID=187102 RepID=UPI0021F3AA83|nr:hypothetical protein [Mycolicibacterium pyrenivorans]